MSEMADGFVRQVVTFVEHIQGVARVRQYCTAAQRQVSQHHVMVGDNHINLAHAFPRFVEGALLKVRAMPVGTLTVIGGQLRPARVFQFFRPAVTVPIPFVAGQFLDHRGEQFLALLIDIDLEAFFLEQLRGGTLRLTFLQQDIQLGQAQITASALGQGKAEIQPTVAHQVGQVLVHDLLLQRHGRRGDHQALARGLGCRNGRQAIGNGLARTGPGLDRHHRRLAKAAAFIVRGDRAQHLGNFGNHQTLAIARLERLGFEKTRIGALDLGLEFSTEHGVLARKAG